MNKDKNKTFNTEEINNVTQSSGVIPADVVTQPQPTLNVPEINMRETAPLANQSLAEAQGQVQEQTKLQELTAQKISDRDTQYAEQRSLAATLGDQGGEIMEAFTAGEEKLEPIAKEITDLTSLINSKTQAIQNQLIDESGRRIPQAFITGRQAIIQQRGTAELNALGSLLDAKNGQMTLATEKLDRSLLILGAVQEAEIAEKEARVNLLKEITGESKEEETNEITRLKEEQEKYDKERDSISAIALQVMQAGGGPDEVNAVINSKNEDEAIAAAKSLGRAAKLEMAVKSATLTKINKEISKMDAVAVPSADDILGIRKVVTGEPTYKTMNQSTNGYKSVVAGYDLDNAVGDLAIVNGIAKVLDPDSTVREGEFDTVESAQAFFEKTMNVGNKIFNGDRLTGDARAMFRNGAGQIYTEKVEAIVDAQESVYLPVAEQINTDISRIAPELAESRAELSRIREFKNRNVVIPPEAITEDVKNNIWELSNQTGFSINDIMGDVDIMSNLTGLTFE